MDTLTHDIYFIQQHEETSPKREHMQRSVTPIYTTPYDSDRHVRLDVPDFYGHRDPEAYLDWEHSIEANFRWHEVLDRHKLQFVEAKLKRTILMWWRQYKESYTRENLGVMSTKDELKATMSKRFKPQDYRQMSHIQLNQFKQGTLSIEEYTNKFQHFATRAGISQNDEILVSLYRQGLQHHIF